MNSLEETAKKLHKSVLRSRETIKKLEKLLSS